jgi:outer membrane receptor for ferrienterochelin and colicins
VSRRGRAPCWRAAALLPLLSAIATGPARAQDISDLEGLLSEQVVSSASKTSERASSAPALSTSISAEDLRRYGIKTLAEAIDFLSIGVASSENLSGGEMGARGVLITGDRGSHFLLLLDGHALNEQVRGSAFFGVGAGIPIEMIDHIEIIVGPGSVLYGSNAMLGLINVVTKRARDWSGVKLMAESAIPTTLRAGAGGGGRFSLFGREGEVTTQIESYRQRGPTFYFAPENTGIDAFTGQPGRYSRAPTGTGIWGGANAERSYYADVHDGVLRTALGNTELELHGSYYRHATPTGAGDFDDPGTAEREWRGSIDLKHHHAFSTVFSLAGRAYADYFAFDSAFITSRGELCPFGEVTCQYTNSSSGTWGGLELQSTWDWLGTGDLVTTLGGEVRGRLIKTSSKAENVDTGQDVYPTPRGLDVRDTILAAYLQQTWQATHNLHFNAGARVDRDPRFPVVVTPRLAVSWTGWRGGTLKAAYADAFRAPSWDETSNATDRRIAADSLAPEKEQSGEASAQQQIGAHRLLLGVFYTRWTDLVVLQTLSQAEAIQAIRDGRTTVPFTPGVQLTQYRNAAAIHNYGLNAGVDGALGLDRFQYGLTVTAAVAEQVEGGMIQRLGVAPQLFGNGRVAYVLGGKLPTVALAAQFMGRRAADHANDGGFTPTPYAPVQVQLRLCVSGAVPGINGLTYRALANYAVSDRGPYVVGPVTTALPTQPSAQLNPIDRFRTTVGLQYEF